MDAELASEIGRRRACLAEEMAQQGMDAVIVASEGNFGYLSGYHTSAWAIRARPICLVVPPEGPMTAVLSEGEAARIEEDAVDVSARPYRDPEVTGPDGAIELQFMPAAERELLGAIAALGARRVGLELSSHFLPGLSPATLAALEAKLGHERVVDASPSLWRLRRRKSQFEVERLREAARVLALAFERFEERAEPGATEQELHRLFAAEAASAGADRVAYTAVLADTATGSLGGASRRRWEPGKLLLIDAGIVVEGYWADFGRVYAARSATEPQQAAYRALVEALASGREAARPGIAARELAAALSGRWADDGRPFGRVGHGVGLDLTEPPSLHADDPTPLEEGMTVCIEPNSHTEEVGNLAAEEEIVLTAAGAELLSPSFPSELKVLG
jgi:Xaa-Pro aminopeptidase